MSSNHSIAKFNIGDLAKTKHKGVVITISAVRYDHSDDGKIKVSYKSSDGIWYNEYELESYADGSTGHREENDKFNFKKIDEFCTKNEIPREEGMSAERYVQLHIDRFITVWNDLNPWEKIKEHNVHINIKECTEEYTLFEISVHNLMSDELVNRVPPSITSFKVPKKKKAQEIKKGHLRNNSDLLKAVENFVKDWNGKGTNNVKGLSPKNITIDDVKVEMISEHPNEWEYKLSHSQTDHEYDCYWRKQEIVFIPKNQRALNLNDRTIHEINVEGMSLSDAVKVMRDESKKYIASMDSSHKEKPVPPKPRIINEDGIDVTEENRKVRSSILDWIFKPTPKSPVAKNVQGAPKYYEPEELSKQEKTNIKADAMLLKHFDDSYGIFIDEFKHSMRKEFNDNTEEIWKHLVKVNQEFNIDISDSDSMCQIYEESLHRYMKKHFKHLLELLNYEI